MIKNERGFAILPFSVIMAAIMATIFMYSSNKSKSFTDQLSSAQGVAYANELSGKFAQRIRWAYDAAKADTMNPALNLCSSFGGANMNIGSSAIRLCLVNNRICVKHPQLTTVDVCITPTGSSPSILVKATDLNPDFDSHPSSAWASALNVLIEKSYAQNIYTPADLPASATSISFTVSSTTCLGGNCNAVCGSGAGSNADCVSFRYCPLVNACTANQMVWQTIALIR